ncbi:DUF5989 family protein [Aliiroseovarius sp. PrR006]|nr:DUF5989 family protein [Aliiroseovarius sp. PrR006]
MSFLRELWVFLRRRKKTWLAQVFLILVVFGGMIVLAQGSEITLFQFPDF